MSKLLARLLHKRKTMREDPDMAKTVLESGAIFNGRYRLQAEIGRGGMGIVYRAHDLLNDRDVAVKVIDPNKLNRLTLQQFLREARIISGLQHAHIVSVYEIGTVDTATNEDRPFIVMELLNGTLLDQMHGFTYRRIVEVGKQVCEALAYIHERGFVYRDLKPGNVILEKCGFHHCVKLIDFGLARPRDEAYLPTESSRAGTVFYLAPELIAGQPAGIGADLYALGATLYEMITGRVPFSNIDEQNILSQHLGENVSPPSDSRSDVPPALEAIVMRLLKKDPGDRFASAYDVWQALEDVRWTPANGARGNVPQIDCPGREGEIGRVVKLLEASRMVTILDDTVTLAQAVGIQLLSEFDDGAWFVQLENVDQPAMVLPAVASVLGVTETSNRPLASSVIESLRNKNLLLILGPCGYLAAACAQLAETILATCPEVYVLAASDRALDISGESCFAAGSSLKNSG